MCFVRIALARASIGLASALRPTSRSIAAWFNRPAAKAKPDMNRRAGWQRVEPTGKVCLDDGESDESRVIDAVRPANLGLSSGRGTEAAYLEPLSGVSWLPLSRYLGNVR